MLGYPMTLVLVGLWLLTTLIALFHLRGMKLHAVSCVLCQLVIVLIPGIGPLAFLLAANLRQALENKSIKVT
jgi:hypothetical protein